MRSCLVSLIQVFHCASLDKNLEHEMDTGASVRQDKFLASQEGPTPPEHLRDV